MSFTERSLGRSEIIRELLRFVATEQVPSMPLLEKIAVEHIRLSLPRAAPTLPERAKVKCSETAASG